jgi:hypothetical protein
MQNVAPAVSDVTSVQQLIEPLLAALRDGNLGELLTEGKPILTELLSLISSFI